VTFEAIEAGGVEGFLAQLRGELVARSYRPRRNRRHEIPKGEGQVRVLGIPAIRDRVVQGALQRILEPSLEADCHDGSSGYRPKRSAAQALARVVTAIGQGKTRVLDRDRAAYFDTGRHDWLLGKVARRVQDGELRHVLKLSLKAAGKRGVPQGGVLSPLLANIDLTEVDARLERATAGTRRGQRTCLAYARYADGLGILVAAERRHDWLRTAVDRRLRAELTKLALRLNEAKTRSVDLTRGERFSCLGFDLWRRRAPGGGGRLQYTPRRKKRTALRRKRKALFRSARSQPVQGVIAPINPIRRGWVTYFRIGHAGRCFGYVRRWVELKGRRHLMRARKRRGFGWKRWSRAWLYETLGLHADYRLRRLGPA
jgi:RNA-directed DNA polymerase